MTEALFRQDEKPDRSFASAGRAGCRGASLVHPVRQLHVFLPDRRPHAHQPPPAFAAGPAGPERRSARQQGLLALRRVRRLHRALPARHLPAGHHDRSQGLCHRPGSRGSRGPGPAALHAQERPQHFRGPELRASALEQEPPPAPARYHRQERGRRSFFRRVRLRLLSARVQHPPGLRADPRARGRQLHHPRGRGVVLRLPPDQPRPGARGAGTDRAQHRAGEGTRRQHPGDHVPLLSLRLDENLPPLREPCRRT